VTTVVPPGPSGVFMLDKYFLNQRVLAIKDKYFVMDGVGNRLLYVEREFFKLVANIHFFTDESKTHPVMSLIKKGGLAGFGDFAAQFTLVTPDGSPIAVFRRQGLISAILRRTWDIHHPDGRQIGDALEDSIILSLLRRYGPMGEIFRTNFIINANGQQVGTFNRKLTIGDKYILDLSADPQKSFDRRVAVALAVLLDTAERR
jgi:uncharacterized protein YxjI